MKFITAKIEFSYSFRMDKLIPLRGTIYFSGDYVLATIASKINVIPKEVYLPISKPHPILAIVNLLDHNNTAKSNLLLRSNFFRVLESTAVFLFKSDTVGVTLFLLAMVP